MAPSNGNGNGRPDPRDYVRLVYSIAWEFASRIRSLRSGSLEVADLIGVGMVTLLKIQLTWRLGCVGGASFVRYAYPRIRWAMLDTIRQERKACGHNWNAKLEADAQIRWPEQAPLHEPPASLEDIWFDVDRLLKPRQAYILRRFFLADRPLAEIGRELGLSEARVCNLKREALAELGTQYNERTEDGLMPCEVHDG